MVNFKHIFVAIFAFFTYSSINISAQEKTGTILFDSGKNMSDFKNPVNDSVQSAFNSHLENSLFTPKPHLIDEMNYNSFSVNHFNQFNFFTTSSDYNWGFEGATSIGLGINWHITDKLILTGNPFITSYYFGPMDYNRNMSVGANVILTYRANNWLTLRTFGQYAYNGFSDPYLNSILAPQNSFGGEVQVKFSNTFELGGGVKYINQGGKWTPQFYTLPLIKIDGTKLFKRSSSTIQ